MGVGGTVTKFVTTFSVFVFLAGIVLQVVVCANCCVVHDRVPAFLQLNGCGTWMPRTALMPRKFNSQTTHAARQLGPAQGRRQLHIEHTTRQQNEADTDNGVSCGALVRAVPQSMVSFMANNNSTEQLLVVAQTRQ